MKANLLFAGLLLVSSFTVSAASHSGKVFADRNGNGVFDKGDRPLSGVMVTDGLNVTKTGNDGSFELPGYEKERFISVTVPSGYKGIHYRKIGDGGSYDFALVPYDPGIGRDGSHTFIQVTDTEISTAQGQEEWVDNIRRYARNTGAAFIMHTGDICYEKGLKAHIGLMNTENMGIPVYYGIGNHDLVAGKYGEALFESIYGPVWYSFDVAGTHYVVLPMLHGDYEPGYTQDDVCRWLKNDLGNIAPGTPLIVLTHDLLTSGDRFIYEGKAGDGVDLADFNLKAWIYGHVHTNYKRLQGDVYTVCTSTPDKGGIDHSSGAFREFTVRKDGSVETLLRYLYIEPYAGIASPQGETACRNLTVNAYSSVSPVKSVTYVCRCQDGKKVSDGRLVQETDWSWTAELPAVAKYAGQKLNVEVCARFEDGSQARSDADFIYSPDAVQVSMSGDWTNLAGNAAHVAEAESLGDGELCLAWTANVGANIFMTSPVLYRGRVYTASVDEEMTGQSHIYALDGRTGDMLWKYRTRGSVKNSIAAQSGCIFAQDVFGFLYAVDASTGELKWEASLPVNGSVPLMDGIAAADGKVYAGSGEGLSAFDASTGELLWRNTEWKQREGTTTTLAAGAGVLVAGVQWMALYANDLDTGRLLWSISDYGLRNRGASASIHGGLLYIVSDRSIFIIEASSGRIVVRRELPYSVDATSTPLLTDSEIIFGTAKEGVVALDSQTLEEKWHLTVGDALVYTVPYSSPFSGTVETSPVLAGDIVYFGASDGGLYGVEASSGKIVWKYDTGAPVFSSVAVSGNTLVAADSGGNVYAFAASPEPERKIVNAMYTVGSRLKSDADIAEAELGDFDFVYLVAAPEWKAGDFDLSQAEINRIYVDGFDYPAGSVIEKYIAAVHDAGGKVLCSFPGSEFIDIASSPERSRKFARMMSAFVHKYDYDGVELDWEHTVTEELHLSFMQEIRKALSENAEGRRYWLTTALHHYRNYTKEQAESLCRCVDWINIMFYDMGGGIWGTVASHNSPLDEMKRAVSEYWKFFPADKIHIGLASYGFYYNGAAPGVRVQAGKTLGDYGRYCNYTELPSLLAEGWTEQWDDKAQCAYFFSPDKSEFMTLETGRSMDAKLEWIKECGFGGVFWWEYTCDWIRPEKPGERGHHLITDYVTEKMRQ